MSAFVLKIIVSVCMLIDHIGAVFPAPEVLRMIGRIAFPVYAYMVAQGCKHTRNVSKYLLRLGIFALISEIPFDMTFYHMYNQDGVMNWNINFLIDTNVFYTLFLGVAGIVLYERLQTKQRPWLALLPLLLVPLAFVGSWSLPEGFSWRIPMTIGCALSIGVGFWLCRVLPEAENNTKTIWPRRLLALLTTVPAFLLASILSTDYGMYGVIFILVFYLAKPESRIARTIAMFAVVFVEYAYPYIYGICYNAGISLFLLPGKMMYFTSTLDYFWFSLAAVVLVFFYNGKPGPKVKWAFYAFYPVHIALLCVIWYIGFTR